MPTTPTTDVRFAGSIPGIYEAYLGPLVFEPYARDLAARVRDVARGAVLETTAGTGILTRALAKALPSDVRIVATDLNDAMLAVAGDLLRAPTVTFRRADAQELPFGDGEFEAVVSQFGMMFLPDRVAGYREARRVLVPGGRFVFNLWGPLDANEVTLVVGDAVAALFPEDPPRFFERMPFGYHDAARIRRDLESAGFRAPAIDTVDEVTQAASAEHAAIGLVTGTPLRNEIEARAPERLDEAVAAATAALVKRFGSSSFENRQRALVVTALRGD